MCLFLCSALNVPSSHPVSSPHIYFSRHQHSTVSKADKHMSLNIRHHGVHSVAVPLNFILKKGDGSQGQPKEMKKERPTITETEKSTWSELRQETRKLKGRSLLMWLCP